MKKPLEKEVETVTARLLRKGDRIYLYRWWWTVEKIWRLDGEDWLFRLIGPDGKVVNQKLYKEGQVDRLVRNFSDSLPKANPTEPVREQAIVWIQRMRSELERKASQPKPYIRRRRKA